jgi:prepilin peptidase CpaA
MISTATLIALAAAAACTDLRWHRIPNALTYPGTLTGLLISGLEPGGIGWSDGAAGFFVCGAVMATAFVCFPNLGGGDVKLLAMCGAFAGVEAGIKILLWTFILAALFVVVRLIWKLGAVRVAAWLTREAWHAVLWRQRSVRAAEQQELLSAPLSLAPSCLMAVLLVKSGVVENWLM